MWALGCRTPPHPVHLLVHATYGPFFCGPLYDRSSCLSTHLAGQCLKVTTLHRQSPQVNKGSRGLGLATFRPSVPSPPSLRFFQCVGDRRREREGSGNRNRGNRTANQKDLSRSFPTSFLGWESWDDGVGEREK